MDVVNPPLMWIDGRCYRINPNRQIENEEYLGAKDGNFAKGFSCDMEDDNVCEMDESLITNDGDSFSTMIEIPSALCGLVIGKGGMNKKRLESETRTKIMFPSRDEEGKSKIVGHSKCDVLSARNRIEILVKTARQKERPTHFVSIPLISDEINERFKQFKSEVLETCGEARGISSVLFQDPAKLHLTIGTLVLFNENERQRAAQVLNRCSTVIGQNLKQKRLLIEMSGVEYMNDDPSEVNVLYGKVSCKEEAAGALQHLADDLVSEFVKEGLMEKPYESVKLHATLMNTTFAKRSQLQNDSKISRTFNAKEIIEKFKDFRFGECNVPDIHLSQLHTKGPDGYYKNTCKIAVR